MSLIKKTLPNISFGPLLSRSKPTEADLWWVCKTYGQLLGVAKRCVNSLGRVFREIFVRFHMCHCVKAGRTSGDSWLFIEK